MPPLPALLSLLDSRDPAVAAQGWELCASLPRGERAAVADALAAQYRWGQAARSLLPDAPARRDALLERFAIDCVAEGLSLLRAAPGLHRFCAAALAALPRLDPPARAARAQQGQRVLRDASAGGPPPLVRRLIFDATLVLLSPRSRDHAARHASALVCRAREEATADGAQLRDWQRQRFFALLLPDAP